MGKLTAGDVTLHRFVDHEVDMITKRKQLAVLNPSRGQTDKQAARQPFKREMRKNPFPVKDEHATVCQHVGAQSSLRNSMVSWVSSP